MADSPKERRANKLECLCKTTERLPKKEARALAPPANHAAHVHSRLVSEQSVARPGQMTTPRSVQEKLRIPPKTEVQKTPLELSMDSSMCI